MLTSYFADILPPQAILNDQADLLRYGKDWGKKFEAKPSLILLPSNINELRGILIRCNEKKIAVVPSGGRTGLSGGATATQGEVVVSLERLNKVLDFNSVNRTLRCEAGVITQTVQDQAHKNNLYFPIDFASKGSSQIGGNLATNAGGIRVIKYGNTRDWVVGVKVMLADGTELDLNGGLIKNQTGFDLKNLIIGSEGTLAIITEVILKLASPPGEILRALVALDSLDKVLPLLQRLRSHTTNLSAFEFFSKNALELVIEQHKIKKPFAEQHEHFILVEIEQADSITREAHQEFFASLIESGAIEDVVLSQNSKQLEELLSIRELIPETLSSRFTVHKNDISVIPSDVPTFLTELNSLIASEYPTFRVLVFGHIGDGNLHVNIIKPEAMDRDDFYNSCARTDSEVFALVQKFSGSISAEHGVGLLKKKYLNFSRSETEIELMRNIKRVFDPNGILNPGKIFDLV